MNRGQMFEKRKRFIEENIYSLLVVKRDFDYIKYARHNLTENEYMRIGDIQGRAITINITGMSLEDIFEVISRMNLLDKEEIAPPQGIVDDADELRAISPLFK